MFNVAVFKLQDILKYIVVMFIIIFMIIETTRFFITKKQVFLNIGIKTQIPLLGEIEKNQKEENSQNNLKIAFLGTQISAIKTTPKKKNKSIEAEEITENKEEDNIEEVKSGQETEIVTQNPIAENYNTQYKNVKIKNTTQITLTEQILTPDITIDNKNIIIYHTHSCESYTSSDKYPYTPTGTFRTTDLKYTVTGVGTELENQLKKYNIPVVHDTSYHDYPAYNGSYTRSLATIENILKTNPADIIIDLHRDAIGSRSDYAPTVKIGEDYAAQIMFVMGTNEGGLKHPNWQQNLKFAIKLQEKAEELYPGLFKPIMVTENRYNQHAGKYASIMEVGATGNTLEQCLTSMKYLAKIISEI